MDFEDSLPFQQIHVGYDKNTDEECDDEEEEEEIYIKIDSASDDDEDEENETYLYLDGEDIVSQDSVFVPGKIIRLKSSVPDEKSEICAVCGERVANLKEHIEKHDNEIECDKCSERFKTLKAYQKHQMCHTETNPFPCETCDLTFLKVIDLIKHNFKHCLAYSCTVCSFKTLNFATMRSHVKRHDESKADFPCDMCGKYFSTKGNLENHMKIHFGIPKYQCEFCPKKFTTEHYKRNHVKFNHTKELFGVQTVYKCSVCSREFSFEKSLERHLSVIHNIGKSRKVNCPVCGKLIANNFNLKMHMTVHTGEKKQVCELCGKTFRDRTHLRRHNKVHEKQGEYLFL